MIFLHYQSKINLKWIIVVLILFGSTLMFNNISPLEDTKNELSSQYASKANLGNSPLAWDWYRTWNTENWDTSYDILNDSKNNIYILGESSFPLVLLKFDRSGNYIYSKNFSGFDNVKYYDPSFSIDSNDDIFIVRKNLLIKLNSVGEIIWYKYIAGYQLELYGIAIDETDYIYLTGSTGASLILIKLNNSGEELWNATWCGPHGNCGHDIAFDNSGNPIVTGETNSFYNWWDMLYNSDIPIIKFDKYGNLLWNVTWRSPYTFGGCCDTENPFIIYRYACGNSITIDSNNNIFITGFSRWYPLILCYNQSVGNFWYNHVNTDGEGKHIKIDTDQNLIVLANYGISHRIDFLLLKYNKKGEQLWNRTWGENDYDIASKMTLLSSTELFAAGWIYNYTDDTSHAAIILLKFGEDSDDDRISNFNENNLYHTNPFNNDTDDDQLSDYDELFMYQTNPKKNDTDDDLLSDYAELFFYKTNPNKQDTDGDGFSDYQEIFEYTTDPNNNLSNFKTIITIGVSIVFILIAIFYFLNKKINVVINWG